MVVVLAMLLAACGGAADTPTPVPAGNTPTAPPAAGAATATAPAANSGGNAASDLPRNQTLYIAGFQWQPPANFNPLNNNPDWPAGGSFMEIFEALFAYNQLSGDLRSPAGQRPQELPIRPRWISPCRTGPSGKTASR